MMHTEHYVWNELEQLLQKRVLSAKMRVQSAKSEQQQRYYKGQVDALEAALRDVANAKFERGIESEAEDLVYETRTAELPQAPETPVKVQPTTQPVVPASEYEGLVKKALKRGIITQRYSHFYCDLFPTGHAKGFQEVYQLIEGNATLRQALQAALSASGTGKRVKKTKKAESLAGPVSESQELLTKALKHGVITQKYSHFYCDLFPTGHAKGFQEVYQLVEGNATLRQAIQAALNLPAPEKPAKKPKKPETSAAPTSKYQELIAEAMARGLITQKYSHFYCDLFPEKHVKGFQQLYQLIEENEALRQAIQDALTSPAETETPVSEPQEPNIPTEETEQSTPEEPSMITEETEQSTPEEPNITPVETEQNRPEE